jgi:hypothetical protein
MTLTHQIGDFLPVRKQLFGFSIGEALAELVRQRYPRDTAKHIARRWDIDPATAANVLKGHASERTLTKAITAEGWDLLACLGAALTGETYSQFEERQLQQIIERAADASQKLVQLRTRREAMASQSLDPDALGDRRPSDDLGARDRRRR